MKQFSFPLSLYPFFPLPLLSLPFYPPSLNSPISPAISPSYLSQHSCRIECFFCKTKYSVNTDHLLYQKLVILQVNSQKFHDLLSPLPPSLSKTDFCLFVLFYFKIHCLPGGNTQTWPRKGQEGNGGVFLTLFLPFPLFRSSTLSASIYKICGFRGSEVKNACNARDAGNGLVPVWGRSPGGGHGNPLQYSCLENSMDRGACGL